MHHVKSCFLIRGHLSEIFPPPPLIKGDNLLGALIGLCTKYWFGRETELEKVRIFPNGETGSEVGSALNGCKLFKGWDKSLRVCLKQ